MLGSKLFTAFGAFDPRRMLYLGRGGAGVSTHPVELTVEFHLSSSIDKDIDQLNYLITWLEENVGIRDGSLKPVSPVEVSGWLQPINVFQAKFVVQRTDTDSLDAFIDVSQAWIRRTEGRTIPGWIEPTIDKPVQAKKITLQAEDINFGTWVNEIADQFAIIALPIDLSGSLAFNFRKQKFQIFFRSPETLYCLEMTMDLLFKITTLDLDNNSIYLHLKQRPYIYKYTGSTNICIENADIGSKVQAWVRCCSIGIHSNTITESDVIKIALKATNLELKSILSGLAHEGFKCRVCKVDKKNYTQINPKSFRHFEQAYLMDVLFSRGMKMKIKITQEFCTYMMDENISDAAKEGIVRRLVDCCDKQSTWYRCRFDLVVKSFANKSKKARTIPTKGNPGKVMVKSAILTPTRVILMLPQPMEKNRMLRENEPPHFLKVSIKDENFEQFSNPPDSLIRPTVVDRLLPQGLFLSFCKTSFAYLAGSNSQLKEHACYLYSQDSRGFTAQHLRESIGDLRNIRCVAKYLARLGLAFSSTSEGLVVTEDVVNKINDVKVDQFCFSDGIGKISKPLAHKLYNKTRNRTKTESGHCPCAFQIRFGGSKGVLVTDPDIQKDGIFLRPSQIKFESKDKTLYVQDISCPKRLFLNHQIITLLSQQGVDETVFYKLQEETMYQIFSSFFDDDNARKKLAQVTRGIISERSLANLKCQATQVPFFRQLLLEIAMKEMYPVLTKARILIPEEYGRSMMGVMDETGKLEYGQVFVKYSQFVRGKKGLYKVVEGDIVVSKMPCIHPGDVRKLHAVNVPELGHLRDVIVFPQQGVRPHPNEMAGSDLDGDQYWVTWYPGLLFTKDNYPAMEYPAQPEKSHRGPITEDDMVEHLVHFIQTDVTSIIARAHLCQADLQPEGIFSPQCLKLAAAHSRAVDAPKSGEKINLQELPLNSKCPDFLQKSDHKPTYKSERMLGKLFRQYEIVYSNMKNKNFANTSHIGTNHITIPGTNIPIQKDLNKDLLKSATQVIREYEEKVRYLQNKYDLTETALLTGNIARSKNVHRNEIFSLQEEIKENFKRIMGETRNRFREMCRAHSPRQLAMAAFAQFDTDSDRALSFPWLFLDWLSSAGTECNMSLINSNSNSYSLPIQISEHMLKRLESETTETQRLLTLQLLDKQSISLLNQNQWIVYIWIFFGKYVLDKKILFQNILNYISERESEFGELKVSETSLLSSFKSIFFSETKALAASITLTLLEHNKNHIKREEKSNIGRLVLTIVLSSFHCSLKIHPLEKLDIIDRSSLLVNMLVNGKVSVPNSSATVVRETIKLSASALTKVLDCKNKILSKFPNVALECDKDQSIIYLSGPTDSCDIISDIIKEVESSGPYVGRKAPKVC